MASVPTIEDVRKAGEGARAAVTAAFEQVRQPLLAAIGVGDVATQAVIDAVRKARAQFTERAEQARTAVDDLPTDVHSLSEKLDPAELRKLVDQYADAAVKLYEYLTEHGEQALDRLRGQPQFKKAFEQFDQAAQAAQQRAEAAVEDARELADEVLGRVVRRTRSTGEKVAEATTEVADEIAEEVHEAGKEAAHEVRGAARKTANRTNTARRTTGTTGTTHKTSTDK